MQDEDVKKQSDKLLKKIEGLITKTLPLIDDAIPDGDEDDKIKILKARQEAIEVVRWAIGQIEDIKKPEKEKKEEGGVSDDQSGQSLIAKHAK